MTSRANEQLSGVLADEAAAPLDGAPDDGLRRFAIVWAGETISTLGRGLTNFALSIWLLQRTGSMAHYSLLAILGLVPNLAVMLPAGFLIDRYDRRRLLIVANLCDGACKLALLVLLLGSRLETWHVYLLVGLSSPCSAVVGLTVTALIPGLVPRPQLSRASGLLQASQALAQLLPPLLAGALLEVIDLRGVVWIDLATYAFAFLAAAYVPPGRPIGMQRVHGLLAEATAGWRYVLARRDLLHLLLYSGTVTFFVSFALVLVPPLVLKLATPGDVSRVLALSGLGYVVGSGVMIAWGGPAQRLNGSLLGATLFALGTLVTGVRPSLTWVIVGGVVQFLALPLFNSCNFAVWQARTPVNLAGRVFAVRRLVTLSSAPLAFALAGPLVDHWFEPRMAVGGAWARAWGAWLGAGPGRGIGLLLIALGGLLLLTQGVAFASRHLRAAEPLVER